MPKRTNDGLKKRCGCGRRTWPKCVHPWHFNFHHGDHEYRFSLDVIARARDIKPLPRSKGDATALRDTLRGEIRRGEFVDPSAPTMPDPPAGLTFDDVVKVYRERHVNAPTRRPSAREMFNVHLNILLRSTVPAANGSTVPLRAKSMDAISKADIEAIRDQRRREFAAAAAAADESQVADARRTRRPGAKGGEVGTNRLLARLRHVFTWAIAEGFVDQTPFKRQGVTVVKLEHRAETARQRRLIGDEEARLLEHADGHLRALIVAALSTGCRRGELLSLRWHQIRRDEKGEARWIELPAGQTKTNQARVIPIGPRLRAELEMRREGPDGKEHPLSAYVFGNATGEAIATIRDAWAETCAKAKIVGLHFHDLRREFACRLLESSADIHDVRDFLGHANITTTSTYLASTPVRLAKALARLDPEPTAAVPDGSDPAYSHTVRTNGQNDDTEPLDGRPVTH